MSSVAHLMAVMSACCNWCQTTARVVQPYVSAPHMDTQEYVRNLHSEQLTSCLIKFMGIFATPLEYLI